MDQDKQQFDNMFNALGNEFTNPSSVMNTALFGAPRREEPVAKRVEALAPKQSIGTPAQRESLRKAGVDPDSDFGRDVLLKQGFGPTGKGKVRRGKGIMEDLNWLGSQIMPQKAVAPAIKEGPMGRIYGQEIGMVKSGGRKPSAYAMFVKQFAAKNPGPNLMKRAGEAWRSRK
jgi:hypothetical protein